MPRRRTSEELRRFDEALPPLPWRAEGTACENCGRTLGWILGVGRYKLVHADGTIRCFESPFVKVSQEDRTKATQLLVEIDHAAQRKAGLEPND